MSQVAKTRILWLMGPNSVQQAKRLNREGHNDSTVRAFPAAALLTLPVRDGARRPREPRK